MIAKINNEGEQSQFDYNLLGQLTRAKNAISDVQFDYDATGNLIEESQTYKKHTNVLSHEYDALGNRIKTTLPSGQVVGYQYNHQQSFTQVTFEDQLITQIQRDASGRETNRQQGALTAQYQYDPWGVWRNIR